MPFHASLSRGSREGNLAIGIHVTLSRASSGKSTFDLFARNTIHTSFIVRE